MPDAVAALRSLALGIRRFTEPLQPVVAPVAP
jgi:hypothetical protein